jgi:oxalate decarboxylase
MSDVSRRNLLVGAGTLAAAAGGGAVLAGKAAAAPSRQPVIDVSNGTPTLPTDSHEYSFPLASAPPTVKTAGGSVTELTQDNFPVFQGNAASVFYLVLEQGALREPHWHPNAWEIDVCVEGRGQLGVVTPDGTERIQTLTPGDIGFIPRGWAHYIRNVGGGQMKFTVVFNHSLPNDIGLSTMFGGMPTDTFSQTLGVDNATLDTARKSPKTLLIVQRNG